MPLPWQKALVELVCDSSALSDPRSEGLRNVLRYLAVNSSPKDRPLRSEKQIRKNCFPEHSNVNISTVIKRLQEQIDEFFGRRRPAREVPYQDQAWRRR